MEPCATNTKSLKEAVATIYMVCTDFYTGAVNNGNKTWHVMIGCGVASIVLLLKSLRVMNMILNGKGFFNW